MAAVAAAFGAHYAKVAGKDGSVSFDHCIKTYLFDGKAQLAVSDHQSDEKSRAALLKQLLGRE